MTPEEPWTRIENSLQHILEVQARMADKQEEHDKDIAEMRRVHISLALAVGAINTSLHESREDFEESRKAFEERDRVTNDKLNKLIANVDRFLEGLRGGNGHTS